MELELQLCVCRDNTTNACTSTAVSFRFNDSSTRSDFQFVLFLAIIILIHTHTHTHACASRQDDYYNLVFYHRYRPPRFHRAETPIYSLNNFRQKHAIFGEASPNIERISKVSWLGSLYNISRIHRHVESRSSKRKIVVHQDIRIR